MSTRPPPPTIPMKWIVVSIVVFIVLYTVVNIYYRKPAPPHRPYEEMVNRTITARLQASGWHRLPVETRRPAEKPTTGGASINRGGKGLGPGLADCYVEPPAMLATIDHVNAPAEVTRGETCTVFFTGSVPNQQLQLGDVILYQHDKEIVLLPVTEHLPGQRLLSRWADANYYLSFPTSALPPGRYQVRVVSTGPALQWSLEVK